MPFEAPPANPRAGDRPRDAAIAEIDARAEAVPRNHWRRLEAALACLEADAPEEALRRIAAIAQAPGPGQALLGAVAGQAAARLRGGPAGPGRLLVPADYLRRWPGRQMQPPPNALVADRTVPASFPADMALPPLTGNANDFGFLLDAAARSAFKRPPPARTVRVVGWVADEQEASRLRQALERQTWPAAALRLTVFAEDGSGDLPDRPWQLPPAQQAALAQGADALVFLEGVPEADPLLIERIARLLAFSPLPFITLGVPTEAGATAVAAQAMQRNSQRERYPSRAVRRLDLALGAGVFAALGGFEPRFEGPEAAALDLAWRAAMAGRYIVPLPVAAAGRRPAAAAGRGDRGLLVQRCACPWDRKADGRYELPKVSIYIPAFKAARFIRAAVDSVLEQDLEDLEVCIADDGSDDDTLAVLERHFAGDPRVRWTTGLNGGIGAASNRAVAMCRGMYVGQLDSDDRLKPGAVRRLAEFLDENPDIGCVYSSAERIDARGQFLQYEYAWPAFSREKMLLTSIAHHFRMFRRQAWMRTEGFREDIVNAVDYDMFLKLSEVTRLHHVEEVLYQRRWHGENTSHRNEGQQTRNTHVVQRLALQRLGLERQWDIHVPEPDQPRKVTYQRRAADAGRAHRVYYWPDYTRSNPYQRLLYARAAERVEIVAAAPATVLALARAAPDPQAMTFHLHWLAPVFQNADSAAAARGAADWLADTVAAIKACGVRIVWTVHNITSHDLPWEAEELALSTRLAMLADAIHLHDTAAASEVGAAFPLPPEKVVVARHGHYIGFYPDFASPAAARNVLGLGSGDEVVVFAGQLRAYKGLDTLVAAFGRLAAERPRARLVLAGGVHRDFERHAGDLRAAADRMGGGRIRLLDRFMDDEELALVFAAADVAVLPYRRVLTSGAMLLALSFGVPVVMPAIAMARSVLAPFPEAGTLWGPDSGPEGLAAAIAERLDAKPATRRAAARAAAAAQGWADISGILTGGTP
ncbi:MAG: glycosyltransferase [Rhodobacteraceae bacterium]|nr:glycosyltransferase [Paracoccaceae bacterium]